MERRLKEGEDRKREEASSRYRRQNCSANGDEERITEESEVDGVFGLYWMDRVEKGAKKAAEVAVLSGVIHVSVRDRKKMNSDKA